MPHSECTVSEQVSLHMSPAQAAQVAGVSRWTVMRAIKSHELQAKRDNRNQWRITPEALKGWRSHSVHTPEASHTKHTSEAMIELREKLAAATARANAAEADRDRWQAIAEKLAERPRRSWWPWR
ncbi:hypothetical protein EOJ32_19965 (plasmid) [Paracoccus sp. Arc7-R13]|nr:hypothetical protein EOJ32_19965 [Paracoccus sp. Arc7-R13]